MSGPIIWLHPSALFAVPALLNAAALRLVVPLPDAPLHLAHDHPECPADRRLLRLQALLSAGRALLLASYCLMWILAAIMPSVLKSFGLAVAVATLVAALLDVSRVGSFLVLRRLGGWHERSAPLAAAIVLLPAGFAMVLFAESWVVLIAGEVVFGTAAGAVYYASLYHALVVKNASVDAGGGHEGLIGLGFAIGPAAGLIGLYRPVLGSEMLGVLAGVGPVVAFCLALAGIKLVGAARIGRDCGRSSHATGTS